jgi:hypothetical protein
VAGLRATADQLAEWARTHDDEIACTWLHVSLQVTSPGAGGTDDATARRDTVAALAAALGHVAEWDTSGLSVGLDAQLAPYGAGERRVYGHDLEEVRPSETLPMCGPVPPRTGVPTAMTPVRRRFLDEMESRRVYAEHGRAWHVDGGSRTERARAVLAAGWCEEGARALHGRRWYRLTDTGRAAVLAYDRARDGAR